MSIILKILFDFESLGYIPSSDFREKALAVTNYKGVEPAMEWLLAHADDPGMETGQTIASSSATAAAPAESLDPTTADEPAEAKSFKCDECGKLFKNQDEVEFHAAKTNHSSFSESTEEKKPLSEEEKKAQLALLEERMKQKRKEREEREKVCVGCICYCEWWIYTHIEPVACKNPCIWSSGLFLFLSI